jgi:hypothetical protein
MMGSSQASVSRLRTFTSCATEFPGMLPKPVRDGADTIFERNDSVPLLSFFQAERQARIERRLVIKTYALGTMRMFAMWLRAFGVWGIRLAFDLAAKRALEDAVELRKQILDRFPVEQGCGARKR